MKKWKYYHHKLLNFIIRERYILKEKGNGSEYQRGCIDTYDIIYTEMKHILDDISLGRYEEDDNEH